MFVSARLTYKNFGKSSYVDTFSKALNLHHGLYGAEEQIPRYSTKKRQRTYLCLFVCLCVCMCVCVCVRVCVCA